VRPADPAGFIHPRSASCEDHKAGSAKPVDFMILASRPMILGLLDFFCFRPGGDTGPPHVFDEQGHRAWVGALTGEFEQALFLDGSGVGEHTARRRRDLGGHPKKRLRSARPLLKRGAGIGILRGLGITNQDAMTVVALGIAQGRRPGANRWPRSGREPAATLAAAARRLRPVKPARGGIASGQGLPQGSGCWITSYFWGNEGFDSG